MNFVRFDEVFGMSAKEAADALRQMQALHSAALIRAVRKVNNEIVCDYCGVASEKRSGTCDHCGAPLNPNRERSDT